MNINTTNFEAFFLDYHEGNLSPQQVAELLLFIEQYPELKEEFESFENIPIAKEDTTFKFENKEILKKQIDVNTIEDYLIRAVEGTLTKTETDLLTRFIKQHPRYQTDYDLFQKTKLNPDDSIVFENKSDLKLIALAPPSPFQGEDWGEVLISSVEGLLSAQETFLLNQQLAADSKLNNDLILYKHTKLVADHSIIYKNKEELKRKERKVIPFFYYVAAAASIALLFSLFIFIGKDTTETKIANTTIDSTQQLEKNSGNVLANKLPEENTNKAVEPTALPNRSNSIANKKYANNSNPTQLQKKSTTILPVAVEQTKNNIADKNAIENVNPESIITPNYQQPTTSNQQLITNNQQLATSNTYQQPTEKIENKNTKEMQPTEFLSLRELAAEKIKEKTLDEATITAQKKSGKNKKINGWDVAQMVTKGISKVTGRNIEVKPTYNEQGNVTAYALGNGVQISRGR